jgi:phosphinothricin acetyltransferase
MAAIRKARVDDIPAITDIYNDAIANTVATFDTDQKTMEEQLDWYESHGSMHPILVAVQEDEVVGWASLSSYSSRCAYSETAEISVYVRDGYRGKGTGKKLAERLLQAGRDASLHTVIALVESGNKASIHIFGQFGFEHVGVMREVGRKFGRLLDVSIMQLIYR